MGNSDVAYRIGQRISYQYEMMGLWNGLKDEQIIDLMHDVVPGKDPEWNPLATLDHMFEVVEACSRMADENQNIRFEGPIFKFKNISLGFKSDIGRNYWYSRVWFNGTKFNLPGKSIFRAVCLGAFAILYFQEQDIIDKVMGEV